MTYYILALNDKSYFTKRRNFLNEQFVLSVTEKEENAFKFEKLEDARKHQEQYGGKLFLITKWVTKEEVS